MKFPSKESGQWLVFLSLIVGCIILLVLAYAFIQQLICPTCSPIFVLPRGW